MNKRKIYLDILRIIATIAVIVIHIVAIPLLQQDVKSINFTIYTIIDSLARFSVPVFFMMSGALFLGNKETNYKKLYFKNILRLFICLCIFFFFYSYLGTYFTTNKLLNTNEIKNIIKSFLSGKLYIHLWFLYYIIALYIISPLLKKLVINLNEKKDIYYYIILMFIFIGILPTLSEFKIFRHIEFLNNFNLGFFSGYISYFVLGYLLDNYELNKKEYKAINILGIIGILTISIGTIFLSIRYKGLSDILFEYESFPVMLYSIFIYINAKKIFSKITLTNKQEKKIVKLSSLTFGIYLIHLFFINILLVYNQTPMNDLLNNLPFTTTIILTALIFLLSLLYSMIISKIPILNKYLI